MSFIDLYANDVWTEADIVHRTEALLHGQVSKEQELILSRKMIGFSLGLVIPTLEEQVELTAYQIAAEAAQQAGTEARADMALLQSAMDVEAAQARLLQPAVTDEDADLDLDAAERASAQAFIEIATLETLTLVSLRNHVTTPSNVEAEHGTA